MGAYGESSQATGVDGDQRDNSTPSSGAAYLFTRSADTWTQRAYLKSASPGVSNVFGWCAAVTGTTVVVGAPYDVSDTGGIYVFEPPPG